MSAQEDSKPVLASLVQAGDQQKEAEAITDFVFMAKDISNAYLVTTSAGDVMVNTGFMDHAERTKGLLAPKRSGALRFIILTQAHPDHYGGVPAVRESGTQVIAERRFVKTGQMREDRVAITEGLVAGEDVVTTGQIKFNPGTSIRIDNSQPLTRPEDRPKQ